MHTHLLLKLPLFQYVSYLLRTAIQTYVNRWKTFIGKVNLRFFQIFLTRSNVRLKLNKASQHHGISFDVKRSGIIVRCTKLLLTGGENKLDM